MRGGRVSGFVRVPRERGARGLGGVARLDWRVERVAFGAEGLDRVFFFRVEVALEAAGYFVRVVFLRAIH